MGDFQLAAPINFNRGISAAILGDPAAASRDDRMLVVKVYCKFETKLSPRTFYRPD